MRLQWSYQDAPTAFGARPAVHSIWCPRWLQPLVLWALRRMGVKVL